MSRVCGRIEGVNAQDLLNGSLSAYEQMGSVVTVLHWWLSLLFFAIYCKQACDYPGCMPGPSPHRRTLISSWCHSDEEGPRSQAMQDAHGAGLQRRHAPELCGQQWSQEAWSEFGVFFLRRRSLSLSLSPSLPAPLPPSVPPSLPSFLPSEVRQNR